MGGGFFDNMWDSYSGAYAYPRTQPRAQYYRPRAPVYEERPAYVQRGGVQPAGKVKVEDSARKTVRTIPVTDGSVNVEVKKAERVEVKVNPVEVKVNPVEVGRRFESEEVAARKIQAVYRGYSVRRTEPLKHLRVIMKVREEFEVLKRRLEDREVRVRVASDAQERLRWSEGIMALLLRLDQLQGVHPEVRVFRKAAAKELLMFQEKIDSMSNSVAEESVSADVAEKDVEDDSLGEEESEFCLAAEERAVEKMEVEEDNKGEVNAEDASQVEAEGALANDAPREEVEQDATPLEESQGAMLVEAEDAVTDTPYVEMEQDAAPLDERRDASQVEAEGAPGAYRETMEQDAASVDEIKDREHTSDGMDGAEISSSEPRVAQGEDLSSEDQSGCPSDRIGESMVEDAEQDGSECRVPAAGVPMVVEVEASSTAPVEDGSLHSAPVMDVGKEEVSGVDDAPPFELEGVLPSEEAEMADLMNENQDVETERLASGAETSTLYNNGDIHEEGVIDAGATDSGDGWIVPASPASLEPRQYSAKSLQVGEPQVSAPGDTSSLSDRILLEQLLEENRKLKDVVGKVLHWGKQQNDIIHSLANRIEHLEEKQPQANMLRGEQINGRKRICNDGGLSGDRARSQRSKGRRKGGQHNRNQLGYLDSEWLSADSDEYF